MKTNKKINALADKYIKKISNKQKLLENIRREISYIDYGNEIIKELKNTECKKKKLIEKIQKIQNNDTNIKKIITLLKSVNNKEITKIIENNNTYFDEIDKILIKEIMDVACKSQIKK